MRGKERLEIRDRDIKRITPAYAGKSEFSFAASVLSAGSPPPMRGKGSHEDSGGVGVGITPAYAGKSHRPHVSLGIVRDHPRLCGEKFCRALPGTGFTGSPPPMRGKGTIPALGEQHTGITPAYAGKRSRMLRGLHP